MSTLMKETATAEARQTKDGLDHVGMLIQGDDSYGIATVTKHVASLLPGMRFVAFNSGPEADSIAACGASVDFLPSGLYFKGFSPSSGFVPALMQLVKARRHWEDCARELDTWCRANGITVLHGHVFAHYFTFCALKRIFPGRYRTIWHIHNNLNVTRHFGLPARFNWLQARRGADYLLCVSRSVAAGWESSGVPVAVIHNCFRDIGAPEIPESGDLTQNPVRSLRLVTGGRMEWRKGQHVALQALKHLTDRGIDVTLDIFGGPLDGNDYATELKAFVAKNGLGGRTRFHGFVPGFAARLREFDIALQCRIDPEPCSMYVLECMGAGMPLVASAGGGTPELLRDGQEGVLYPPGDSEQMAKGILRLAQNSAERIRVSIQARERASAEFSREAFQRRMRSFYDQIGRANRMSAQGTAEFDVFGRSKSCSNQAI